MNFNFTSHVIKNFQFLKNIEDFQELNLCILKLNTPSKGYLTPLSKINFIDDGVNTEYINNKAQLVFIYKDKLKTGEFLIELSLKDESLNISKQKFNKNLEVSEFNKAVDCLIKWCESVLLAKNIKTTFNYKVNNYEGPEDMILTAGPLITHYENIYTLDAVNNGWNTQWSKYLDKFENEFSNYIGSKFAISTSSCTGALYLSLLACGIGEGDEVIVPELTWVATASAIKYVGATPVFADVDLETWCIDTNDLQNILTENTKAIMPVHLYGNPAEMSKIMSFANENNLSVIEDAAPAIGATYNNQKVGSFGDFGCFSFQGAKLLVTGEGGMVVTNDEEKFNKLKKLWDHGRVPGTFWIDELGYKFKMSNLQAAFGLGQLENIEALIESKKRNYTRYVENLKNTKGIKLSRAGKNTESIYWMTSVLIDSELNIEREALTNQLRDLNIDTRPVFPAISQYPIWGKKYKENPNSKIIAENAFNLPSGVNLKKEEIDYICESIISIMSGSY